MQWHDIEEHYPDRWLIVEALEARSADDKRVLGDLEVLDSYTDSESAVQRCGELNRQGYAVERAADLAHGAGAVIQHPHSRQRGSRAVAEQLHAFIRQQHRFQFIRWFFQID